MSASDPPHRSGARPARAAARARRAVSNGFAHRKRLWPAALAVAAICGCGSSPGGGNLSDPSNPLVGYWTETGRIDCNTGQIHDVSYAQQIQQLEIDDTSMYVAWDPYEPGYYDYSADYAADPGTGVIALSNLMPAASNIPADLDGSGHYQLSAGPTLTLTDFWFGTPGFAENPPTSYPRMCGHVFDKLPGPARTGP